VSWARWIPWGAFAGLLLTVALIATVFTLVPPFLGAEGICVLAGFVFGGGGMVVDCCRWGWL
jgi:hypothetical protein